MRSVNRRNWYWNFLKEFCDFLRYFNWNLISNFIENLFCYFNVNSSRVSLAFSFAISLQISLAGHCDFSYDFLSILRIYLYSSENCFGIFLKSFRHFFIFISKQLNEFLWLFHRAELLRRFRICIISFQNNYYKNCQ